MISPFEIALAALAAVIAIFWTWRQANFRKREPWQEAQDKALEWLEETSRNSLARKVSDIHITISSLQPGTRDYLIEVLNLGNCAYSDLNVEYRELILWAERFGLDTTHMPASRQYAEGDPIFIDQLAPKQRVQFERQGYASPAQYDGPRGTQTALTFRCGDDVATTDDRRWCEVKINF